MFDINIEYRTLNNEFRSHGVCGRRGLDYFNISVFNINLRKTSGKPGIQYLQIRVADREISFMKYDLEDRLILFASRVIDLIESLPVNRACNHLSGQLVRSGTSPALSYGEAQSGESRRDFIHKLKIGLKELRETRINLKIIQLRKYVPESITIELINENVELISIFVKSIATAKKNLNKPPEQK